MKIVKIILAVCFLLLFTYGAYAQTSEVTFEEFKLNGIGLISIPSIMELQSGLYKNLSDKLSKEAGYDVSGVIIFQQAGRNDLFNKTNTYARVMIEEELGNAGDYQKIAEKLVLTPQEKRTLDTRVKNEFINEFQSSGTGVKLVKWDGVSVDAVNGMSALKIAYLRQLNDNPAVYVEIYHIQNYNRKYILTISYRLEDASIWKESLNKTKNSFTVTAIQKPATRIKK